jgi:hypothetical protein
VIRGRLRFFRISDNQCTSVVEIFRGVLGFHGSSGRLALPHPISALFAFFVVKIDLIELIRSFFRIRAHLGPIRG